MPTFASEAQKLAPSALISLFTLDATPIGGPVWHFAAASETGGVKVHFGGVEYTSIGVELRGLITSGVAELPRPELVIANDELIQAIVNTWGNLNNCVLTRYRTFSRFLDGQAEADPTAFYGPDIFVFDRKSSDKSDEISWELSASIDQEGANVGREMIRNTCMWRYRQLNVASGTFDYSKAKCPYVGTKYYNIDDVEVFSPTLDVPSRNLGCCRARFGHGNPLPFGGFVGIQRSRS